MPRSEPNSSPESHLRMSTASSLIILIMPLPPPRAKRPTRPKLMRIFRSSSVDLACADSVCIDIGYPPGEFPKSFEPGGKGQERCAGLARRATLISEAARFVNVQRMAGVSGFEPELQGFGDPPTAVILHPWDRLAELNRPRAAATAQCSPTELSRQTKHKTTKAGKWARQQSTGPFLYPTLRCSVPEVILLHRKSIFRIEGLCAGSGSFSRFALRLPSRCLWREATDLTTMSADEIKALQQRLADGGCYRARSMGKASPALEDGDQGLSVAGPGAAHRDRHARGND